MKIEAMSVSSMKDILSVFLRLAFLFFVLTLKTEAQNLVAVTGNLQDPSGAPVTSNGTFVRFSLRNFGSQIPTSGGIPTSISWPDKDFTPDSNGNLSGTIITNASITAPAGTFYHVCIWYRNQLFRCNDYIVNAAFNLNTAVPLNTTPNVGPNQLITQSFLCSNLSASTNWTCNHNLNDQFVLTRVFDLTNSEIHADHVQNTTPNTTVITFVTAQAGTARIVTSGSIVIGSNQGNVVLQSGQTGAQTIVGGFALNIAAPTTFTGGTNTLGPTGGLVPKVQIFTSSGTFTIPAGVTAVKVTVVAGGGAGGGAAAGGNSAQGGGSGSAAIKWLSGLTPGNTLIVTVGLGGAGATGTNGNNGTSSSVTSGTQTITPILTSGGGGGGFQQNNFPGGGGAAGTGGDLNLSGQMGQPGFVANPIGVGGAGAPSILGGAANSTFGNNNGVAGTSPGSGGSGSGGGAGALTGGAGANGIVIFEWVN